MPKGRFVDTAHAPGGAKGKEFHRVRGIPKWGFRHGRTWVEGTLQSQEYQGSRMVPDAVILTDEGERVAVGSEMVEVTVQVDTTPPRRSLWGTIKMMLA
jgi:hypothetical protein